MTTVFILAAGEGSRWGNFRGTPKYKTLVEGEVLIERTYRQFSKYTKDIAIVCNEEYPIEGIKAYIPPHNENWKDIAKFWSSKNIWSSDRNILIFGDIYFTDEAVDKIMNDQNSLSFYLRKHKSLITGKDFGEIWGIGFDSNKILLLETTMLSIIESNEQYKTGGWHLYKKLRGNHKINLVEIDDWTEDFDFPKDIEMWEKRRNSHFGRGIE